MHDGKIFAVLANAVVAHQNCVNNNNDEWKERWEDRINYIMKEKMPSGSGFDSGVKFDMQVSGADLLVFTTSFHHMDPNGFYDGWSEHVVKVTPSFISNFDITVTGRNKNDIKGYISQTFADCLNDELEEWPDAV